MALNAQHSSSSLPSARIPGLGHQACTGFGFLKELKHHFSEPPECLLFNRFKIKEAKFIISKGTGTKYILNFETKPSF